MGPEATWLFTTMFVELERALPLDEGAETDLAEYLVKFLSGVRCVQIIPVSVQVNLIDLTKPLELQASMLLHGISQPLRQVRSEAARHCSTYRTA